MLSWQSFVAEHGGPGVGPRRPSSRHVLAQTARRAGHQISTPRAHHGAARDVLNADMYGGSNMETNVPASNTDLDHARNRLSQLRDETRLKIHLAGMDLKEEWRNLETGTEDAITDATAAARDKVVEALKALEGFVGKLKTSR
jgi:hypothetical protein